MTLPRLILCAALVVGLAADALLRAGFDGIAFPLWIALVGLAALAIARRDQRATPREAVGWLVVALLAAGGLAWRASEELMAFDFLATLLALGLAAMALGQPRAAVLDARLRDTVWTGARVLRDVLIGALPLTLRELLAPGARETASRRGWPAIRTTLIVVALLVVFGSLLRAADPIFASLLAIPHFDIGTFISHLLVIGFFAWVFAGWSRGAFISPASASRPPERLPVTLGMTDMTAALATLDVLFALFILAQLGWLFGGEAFLQARTGLTAAQYARRGFFQMVIVVLLVVPLLLATRTLRAPGADTARRHTLLAVPMVVLLLAMIASAALRMRLYVQYFGLTSERFYTLAIMAWLAFVLVWLAATTLRGRDRHFLAGAVLSGFATLFVLNVIVPDRLVARVNVARAQRATPTGGSALDVAYLSTLGGDAIEPAIAATLAPPATGTAASSAAAPAADVASDSVELQRCRAARRIRMRWGPASRAASMQDRPGAWRRWNAGEQRALRLAAANETALRAVQQRACAAESRAGARPAVVDAYR
ncbi:MAG TPA: DUF4173 domain-containing protein [Gemmatimonadaceae bacterium]|nr:DUF4173 domain-containing protein [Gemmatimonadaceae bacterium]